MTRIVTVVYRNVYGRDLCYPANQTASRFCALTGNLTLSPGDLAHIKALGYTVEVATYIPQAVSA